MSAKRLKCNIGEYGVIVNNKNECLILKLPLNKEFPQEAWMLPGGRINEDEQPEQGLKREILEETGLDAKILMPVHVARWGNERPPKYSVFFLCKLVGKQRVSMSNEHTESAWISFKDIQKVAWHNINSKIAIQKSKKILES